MHLHPPGTTARFFQENPVAAIDTLEALKFAMEYFPNVVHPARLQGMAAIELVEVKHAPRRGLAHSHYMKIGEGGAMVECRWDYTSDGDMDGLEVWMDTKDIFLALSEKQVLEIEAECLKVAKAAQADSRYDAGQVAYEEKMAA